MKLSDAEQRLVARLRKRQRDFVRLRWLLLIFSALSMGAGIFGLVGLYHCYRADFVFAVAATFMAPLAYLFFFLGVWLAADTLISWRGRAEVDLLLRLIEDSRDDA